MARTIYILDPRAETRPIAERPLPKLPDLAGRTVAILNNGWTSMDRLADHLATALKNHYGVADIVHVPIPITSAADPAVLDRVAQQADFAIVGLAN